jgi:hypothetical protein
LEGVEDFMAAAEDFMGVAVTSLGAILVVVAMDGAAAAMGGVAVTGEVGTVVVGMAVVGMVVVRIGGGVTHTRMDTGLTVGKSLLGERTGSGECPVRSRVCAAEQLIRSG